MRRLQRLHAIVEHLRARRTGVTVAELADRFGVAERTIFRDLAALRGNDLPIESSGGPMGGVRLGKEYQLPPLGLSVEEAMALWLAVQLRRSDARSEALLSALDKVLAGIPEAQRAAFQHIRRRLVVAPAAPAELAISWSAPAPDIYRTCERAFLEARRLRLRYIDLQGRETEREVEAHGLLVIDPVWYLLAEDGLRGAPRTFRLDRIQQADAGPPGAFKPVDPRTLFAADGQRGPCGDRPRASGHGEDTDPA